MAQDHQISPENTIIHAEVAKPQTKQIWKVAGILAVLTTLEFVIAFALSPGMLKNVLFYGLTIIKAAYIVGEFMHLKHEVKSLMWAILLPMIFVIWLLIALRYEGSAILLQGFR